MGAPLAARRPISSSTLFTIGYEGRSLDEYCRSLIDHGIRAVVDVRKNPISRKKGFSKKALGDALACKGIVYFHLPALGIDSALRKDLDSDDAYRRLFDYYEREILPKAGEALASLDDIIERYGAVALTCFERDPDHCHRRCVAERCLDHGASVTSVAHL